MAGLLAAAVAGCGVQDGRRERSASPAAAVASPTPPAGSRDPVATPTPGASASPASTGEADPSIRAGGPRAAEGLAANVRCSAAEPGVEIVELRWMPAAPRGDQQRVDVTLFSEAFDDGRYASSDPLPADQSELEWRAATVGSIHFWRVLTRRGQVWLASETGQFTPQPCILDQRPSPTGPG